MCDNEAVTNAIASGMSKSPEIMSLLHQLFFCAARHHFAATTKHIPGKYNVIADTLSRFNMQVFHQAALVVNQEPTPQTQLPRINT